MRAFLQTGHCLDGAHCSVCRDRSRRGRAWRRAISKVLRLPAGGIDFECPYAVPWGGTRASLPSEPLYEKVIRICAACPLRQRCPFWRQSTCRKRRIIQRVGAVCPAKPPRWGPVVA